MAKKNNINQLYDNVFAIKEMLTEVVETALEIANDAEAFGGEISRVVTGQVRQSLVPSIQKYIDGKEAGSIASLIEFLDSVPLAWTRVQADDARVQASGTEMIKGASSAAAGKPAGVVMPPEPPATDDSDIAYGTKLESKILGSLGKVGVDFNRLQERFDRPDPQDLQEKSFDFASLRKGLSVEQPSYKENTEEDYYFNKLKESSTTGKERLQEGDFLAGPYKMPEEDLGGMKDWRQLVEYTRDPLDETDAVFAKLAEGKMIDTSSAPNTDSDFDAIARGL